MKNIYEALDYLYSFINYETDSSYSYESIHYNVERTVRLLDLLSNPERSMRIIHVAGTKGKGSVCKILSSLIGVQKLATGLFTSPHIMRVNERISVDGKDIEDRELVEMINLFPPLIDTFSADNRPTTFEILTALAMQYFKIKGVRFAILETGMGGRFDSTNFADPDISVITSISYDHMDKLGSSIEQIAGEKAGIIKKGKPVVVGYQRYGAARVFQKKAEEMESPCYTTQAHSSYEIRSGSPRGTSFDARVDDRCFQGLFLSLSGKHQVENALTALHALKILDLLPDDAKVKAALSAISFPARLELIEKQRRFLLDSAHNAESVRVLVEAVKELYRFRRLIVVVGIVKGKDVRGILEPLAEIATVLIITDPVTHKDLDTPQVLTAAKELFSHTRYIEDIYEAIRYGVRVSDERDIILITGSFYTTSPARSYILNPDPVGKMQK
jgi:dihydrofolate synthase/folylpolyglutamate synthase